jgi:hypothetical protein
MDQELESRDSEPETNRTLRSALIAVPKFGCFGLVAAVVIWVLSGWLGSRFPQTVAREQKSYPYGLYDPYGYSVEKYRWRTHGVRVHIWAEAAVSMFNMSFDAPDLELVRVKTHRWLANDRALLLELDYRVRKDSSYRIRQVALLYDFEHGELHSRGSASDWFVWQPDRLHSQESTRGEFYRALNELSTTSRSDPKVDGQSGR